MCARIGALGGGVHPFLAGHGRGGGAGWIEKVGGGAGWIGIGSEGGGKRREMRRKRTVVGGASGAGNVCGVGARGPVSARRIVARSTGEDTGFWEGSGSSRVAQ
jgi:hypothetical protein